jgi:polyisoprenoid-binding protein YceI
MDVSQSVIQWKGTKMRGLGKHEGIIKLQSGFVWLQNHELCGGEFVVDMRTIEVTDIPKSDPIPRRNLRNHLMDDDFFAVARYPTAKLTIIRAMKESSKVYIILADLTIKNMTRRVEFKAVIRDMNPNKFSSHASLTFNRHLWDISFKGSALQNNLVDDDIILEVFLQSR